jgi:hypothetical protein
MSQDLGLDRSGNGNNWTLNNLTIADQMIDRPTNNFATQNPLCNAISNAPDSGDASPTFSKGNLRIVTALTPAGRNASTIGVLSGKYYAEMYHEAGVSAVTILKLPFEKVGEASPLSGALDIALHRGFCVAKLFVGRSIIWSAIVRLFNVQLLPFPDLSNPKS